MHTSLKNILLWLYVLAVCMVLAGTGWFVKTVLSERTELAVLRADQTIQEQQSARATETRSALRDTQKARAALFAVTGTTGAVDVIDLIDAAADEAKISAKVDSASPGNPHPKDKTLQSYTFSVHTTGTYDRVTRFLQLLITLPNPLIVDRLSLQRIDKEWEGFVTITVYVAPIDATPKKQTASTTTI